MIYPTIDLKATGERIRELRKEKHLTVRNISDYMGFNEPQAVYKWQRGDALPTVDNLFALSVLFETPMDNIIVRERLEEAEHASSFLYFYIIYAAKLQFVGMKH